MSYLYSDDELCLMAKDPKERELAFRIILKTYQERLYSVIRNMVHSHEDTDDILQNTFVKVHKYLPAFQNKSSLYTWIYRIAINETLRFLAQNKAQKRVMASAFEWAKVTDAYEMDSMDEEKTWLLLNEGIELLPPRQKLVFNLRYFEKMTYAEMADILKVTEGSLKASFHHALGKLNEFIKKESLMKEEEKDIAWEKEISEIAPWLPLKVSKLQSVEAPNGYYDSLEKALAEKIGKISTIKHRRKYIRPLLASAAGFLLLFSLAKFFWMDQRDDKKETEYTIYSLSTEEAALWLGEEAVISELDIQLFAEEMTLNTVEIKTKNK